LLCTGPHRGEKGESSGFVLQLFFIDDRDVPEFQLQAVYETTLPPAYDVSLAIMQFGIVDAATRGTRLEHKTAVAYAGLPAAVVIKRMRDIEGRIIVLAYAYSAIYFVQADGRSRYSKAYGRLRADTDKFEITCQRQHPGRALVLSIIANLITQQAGADGDSGPCFHAKTAPIFLMYDSRMSEIKPSILLSSILPFNRLEHKLVFVLILALLAPLSMVTLQWQADRVPESLVPAPATVFWTTMGCLALAALLVYLLLYPVYVLSRAVEQYHLSNDDPGLPAYFTDPTGRLLGNIQLLIRTVLRQERLLKEVDMEVYLGEVHNRVWCERRLKADMERSRLSREPLSIGILMLGNLDYLKASEGPGIAQYCQEHLLNSIHGNTPVEHWVARWDEGQVLFVAWARTEEAEIICNRIQSGIRSTVLRTPMGKTINLNLRQCLYHYRPEHESAEVLAKLEAAVANLCVQDQGAYPSLLLVA
jgi:hypothetical protein